MKKVVFLLIICLVLMTGCSVKKNEEVTDAEKFAAEYTVSKNNIFKYVTIEEVLSVLNNGTGIIFFGNSDYEDSSNFIKIFNDVIDDFELDEIYYYNPTVIKNDNILLYDELVSLLNKDNLDEEDNYLNVPSLYFVFDGKVIRFIDYYKETELEDFDEDNFYNDLEDKCIDLVNDYYNYIN